MSVPEIDSQGDREKLIQQRKKQVWMIALAMVAGGCLVTTMLLGLLYFLFTRVFPLS